MAYRSDALRLNQFKFPHWISNFFTRFLLPLIQTPPRSAPRNPIQLSTPTAAATPRNASNRSSFDETAQIEQLIRQQQQQQQFMAPPVQASEESVQALVSMGFAREAAVQALVQANNNLDLATNILLDN